MKLGETLGLPDDHVYITSETCECSPDREGHCMVCDGGLSLCKVCGALEGALPTQCPKKQMTYEELNDVHRGLLDFRRGNWLRMTSRYSPVWWRTAEGQQVAKEAEADAARAVGSEG